VTLPQVPKRVQKLLIVANIYESAARRQHLGQVENAYIRLVDLEHEVEIARYNFSNDDYCSTETGIILAEIYRQPDNKEQWQVEVLASGLNVSSLQELVEQYS